MSSPEPSAKPIDLTTLLNTATLRLAPDVRTTRLRDDRIVVKSEPACRHLVVSPRQWAVLREFGKGKTVPAQLFEVISSQRCPPLREFYELVVKAVQTGILLTEAHPAPPPVKEARWRVKLNGRFMRWLAITVMAGSVIAILLQPMRLPPTYLGLLAGWVLACLASSLGYVLAACVVRSGGGGVYHPRLDWLTPAPRFRVDLIDAVMGGRNTEVDAALTRLAPPFLFTAVAAWEMPGAVFPLLGGIFLHLSPLWHTPLLDLLKALYRDPRLATAYDLVFAQNRLFALLLRTRQQFADRRFLLACAGATLVWLLVLFLTGCVLLQANAGDLVERFHAAGGLKYSAYASLAIMGALVVGAAGLGGWIAFSHLWGWWQEWTERRRKPRKASISREAITEILGRTVLFRDLPPDDLHTIATVVQPEEHPARSYVTREGETGDRLYVVVSGRLEVRRDYAPGRSEPVAAMREGDVFGELALLHGGRRTRSIRSRSRSVLLALDQKNFQELVLSHFSRQAVEETVQKVGFLQHVEMTRGWTHAAIAAFARRTKSQEYKQGDVVIVEGTNNNWLFLIHRGEFAAMQGRHEIRKLKNGDTFGELSLLQDGLATASIVVRSRVASCLLISKRDFLEFITQDFAIALRFEEVSSKRLRQAIFAADSTPSF
jgi:CRP-like cAMP-binding protein